MYEKSNFWGRIPNASDYKIPRTQAEFSEMGYDERLWLFKNHPTIYRRFTDPNPKRW